MIRNYDDFVKELRKAGFSTGYGSKEEVFSLCSYFDKKVAWHTSEPETDPWEWRMRVLEERSDIAYGKLFFKKSGYITKEWYPFFLAVRRKGMSFAEAYRDGTISQEAKRIYQVVQEYGNLPVHSIKKLAGFSAEDKSKFDRAVTELQMRLYLTMCGRRFKESKKGEEYGWSSTVLCTTEKFWDDEVFTLAGKLKPEESAKKIESQILLLNPDAKEKRIERFIYG